MAVAERIVSYCKAISPIEREQYVVFYDGVMRWGVMRVYSKGECIERVYYEDNMCVMLCSVLTKAFAVGKKF